MAWTIPITPSLMLEVQRCSECGSYWAREERSLWKLPRCPFCAGEAVANAERAAEQAAVTISRMRGALTRAKNRSKHGR